MAGRFALLLRVVTLITLVAVDRAQERGEHPPRSQEPRPQGTAMGLGPDHVLEFAASSDSLWLGYRDTFLSAKGYTSYGFLASEDDDLALSARLVRYGVPRNDTPLGLGIGLGLLGATIDGTNEEVLAVTLTGNLEYRLELDYPLRFGLEASFSPGVATFFDGEGVLDLLGRVELELSDWAWAFVGYRRFELDLEEAGDHDLDSAFHVGVRMGF
jgi:hypothetical protein